MKKIYITEPSEIIGPRVYKDKKRAHSKIDPGYSTGRDITYVSNELRPIPHPKITPSENPSIYIEQKTITRNLIAPFVKESLISVLPSSTIDVIVEGLTIGRGSLEDDIFDQGCENHIKIINENPEAWNKRYQNKGAARVICDRIENLSSTESIRSISKRTEISRGTVKRILDEWKEDLIKVAEENKRKEGG
jgi:hypothetical protein